ncbi:MAG: hypothetical protein V4488_10385 [Pseudomonadota bacterium]
MDSSLVTFAGDSGTTLVNVADQERLTGGPQVTAPVPAPVCTMQANFVTLTLLPKLKILGSKTENRADTKQKISGPLQSGFFITDPARKSARHIAPPVSVTVNPLE